MRTMKLGKRLIGAGHPCYTIAEISCNHNGNFTEARALIEESAKTGVDAVKLQTYTPQTITRNFKTTAKGTIWDKMDLFSLYGQAYTPWEWHAELKKVADDCNLDLFSSPFDESAVDHLEQNDVPVYKISSFEIVDTNLLRKIAKTGKPVIMSNGMTDYLELSEAVGVLRNAGVKDLTLLHCNSGYPAEFAEANLKTIPAMAALFDCPVGLSDHTLFADTKNYTDPLAHVTPLEAVRFGASIVEFHIMSNRAESRALMEQNKGGFDWPFSREPHEVKKMVDMIRHFEKTGEIAYTTELERTTAAKTHGHVCFEPTEKEIGSRQFRPSLWVVADIKKGETIHFAGGYEGNVDSIRPGGGLAIRFADFIDGRTATRDLKAGEPLSWDMFDSAETVSTSQKRTA